MLIDEKAYKALIETLYIASMPGMRESILKARNEPIETYSDKIDWDNV